MLPILLLLLGNGSGKAVSASPDHSAFKAKHATDLEKLRLWHHRLGHLNKYDLAKIGQHTTGINDELSAAVEALQQDRLCYGCSVGKSHRQPFGSAN
ncbi:hypothetical protein DFS34DRAFT_576853 [Phlyctochytrium arcticum]|nr:hypothetical protein DFS34DRAFT_576853 [Phlyctochytrium arcticum]